MKVGKVIYKTISAMILIIMIVLAVLLIGVRVVGFTPYTVLSGSMEPEYPVGSLIYVKDIEPKDIVVGDNITFVLDESLTVVTHQVVEIDEGHEHFTTKGIANDSNDGAPVYYENILGKACFCVPVLGYIADRVTSPIGLIISVAAILIWCIIIYMIGLAKEDKEEKAKSKEVESKEVKSKEVKSKEVKSKEVKSKEIKSKEVENKVKKPLNKEEQERARRLERIGKGQERAAKRRKKRND